MKNKIFSIITIFSCILIIAQEKKSSLFNNLNDLPKEKIFVHSNSNFLLTGETLYYKIYCLDQIKNSLSTYSKVAYIELINSDNKSIVKQKINLIKSSGYGDFFLNTTIKTGAYKLISYTQWMRNKQLFYEEDIFIVNPFSQKIREDNNIHKTFKSFKKLDSISSKNSKTYSKREKVLLDLPLVIQKNVKNFSISIKKKEKLNLQRKNNYSSILTSFEKEHKSNYFYLPELRGSLIKGKIVSKNFKNNKVSNIRLSLSIKNDNSLPKTAITNKLGEFYFNIKNIRNSTIAIQILDDNFDDYHLNLGFNNSLEKKFVNFKEIYLNDTISKIIRDRSLNLQIENAYYSIKKDSIYGATRKKSIFDYNKIVYKLDEYKRFNSVKKTFIEIIKKVNISKKNNNYQIHVFGISDDKNLSSLPSLLIIDGNIIYNHNDFMDFNPKRINTISIINNKYFYGSGIYQGIVIIDTYQRSYLPNQKQLKEFNILKPQPKKKYFFQKHKRENERIPDYRTQLYWNPNIDLSTKEITFYTSDVSGEFEIEIEGFTQKGKPISLRKTFFVD
ncbi:hypothetical protein [Tenacibaculum ovolyticum]|uniref:hypothetical protein n=1 Tax=Tenacibaculum ovolyticum TaxID=104270 RepID=UPI00042A2456|nr:hypothetical protein [Tenacibaculum ovolyticum]